MDEVRANELLDAIVAALSSRDGETAAKAAHDLRDHLAEGWMVPTFEHHHYVVLLDFVQDIAPSVYPSCLRAA